MHGTQIFYLKNLIQTIVLQATKELRNLGVHSMIVGISDDQDHTMEDFIQAGMDQFYKKPLKAQTITSVLRVLQGN